jgi:cytochrome P450
LINELEAAVRERVRELTADFRERGRADLASDFGRLLPLHVICDLVGFPEEDHAQLGRWFGDMVARIPGQVEIPAAGRAANDAMREYVRAAIRERATQPREDLLTTLAEARRDGALSIEEAASMPILLFFAGIQTTSGLLGNAFHLLARHPDERRRLQDDLAAIPGAVEEFLRFDAPIHWLARTTTRDVELHERTIPAGARVLMLWGSANRDERRWAEPDRLDVLRPTLRHITFGDGIHHCLGAPLARLEARVALEHVLVTLPAYELAGPVERLYTPGERALAHVPVVFAGERGASS